MIEIELKFKISDIHEISKKIVEIGAELTQKRTFEKTTMFDNKERLMQKTDGRVRLGI